MSRVQPPNDEMPPEDGNVFEEEDEDLDLSLEDLAVDPALETVEERLQRAAQRAEEGNARSIAQRMREAAERGKSKALENKQPGEQIVEEDDDEDLGDLSLGDVADETSTPEEFKLEDTGAPVPEVGVVDEGWDDTEAIERNKLELMRKNAGPATVVEMKLDAMGVPPAADMQAGPMTMAIYEAEQNLTLGPISDTDTGSGTQDEQQASGENPPKLVDNRAHELSEEQAGPSEAEPSGSGSDFSTPLEEAKPQLFNSEIPGGAGETITYRRDGTGQVVRTGSGRLMPVVPDRTLSYERDETGQIVRSDHLARRIAAEGDEEAKAIAARKVQQESAAREAELQRLETARLEAARLEEEIRQAQAAEQEAENQRLAEEARRQVAAKIEEQRLRREAQEAANRAQEAARKRQESERQAAAEVKRRAEEQKAKSRDEQNARQTYEEEVRRREAEQAGIKLAQEHAGDFEREMSARRDKHEARKREQHKGKRAMDEEIARLEAEAKTRRAREAVNERAWQQHAAKGSGRHNQTVNAGKPSGVVSGGNSSSANTKDSQPEVSLVSDDSGAPLGRGLDVGTANLVAARMDAEGGIEFFPARNAFLDVPEDPYTLKMLKSQGVPYIKRENKLYVIGQDAFELANIFNREMRRPMKNGLISPTDADAMPMEVELFKKILGPPRVDGEACYYSIPADPVDSTMNIVYHTNIANGLLQRLGYKGTPFNEGLAIVFSELGDDEFTGIGISCGGGMVNVCVAFRSMNVISFSSAKGGDWIDQQAAQVMGCAASRITHIKESGVDINAPKSPEEEAIVIYYRHLIKYSLDNIVKKFSITKDIPNFPKPVPIAVSGGTSMVGGFIEVFKDEFSKMSKQFPIKVSDIRRAEDQFNATAKGCLLAALSNEE